MKDRVGQLEDSDIFVLAESSSANTKTKHTQTSYSYETKTESTASGEYLSVAQNADAILTIIGESMEPFSRNYKGRIEDTAGTMNRMILGGSSGSFSSCAYDSKGLSGANIQISASEGIKIQNNAGKQFLIENANDRNRGSSTPSILINGHKGATKLRASNEASDPTEFYSSCVTAEELSSHLATYGKVHGVIKDEKDELSSVTTGIVGIRLYTKNGTVEMNVTDNPTATINTTEYKVPLVPVSGIETITVHDATYHDENNYQWAQIPGPGLYLNVVPVERDTQWSSTTHNYILIDIPNLDVRTDSLNQAPQFDSGHAYDYSSLAGYVYLSYYPSITIERSDTGEVYDPPRVIEHAVRFHNRVKEDCRIEAGRFFRILKY